MLSRKNFGSKSQNLTEDFMEDLQDLLDSTYKKELTDFAKKFHLYGKIYKDELLLICGLQDLKNPQSSCVSFFLSADIKTKKENKKTFSNFVNYIGHFYDSYFGQGPEKWNDYFDEWAPFTDEKSPSIFYKVTRENIMLTLEANKILNEGKASL